MTIASAVLPTETAKHKALAFIANATSAAQVLQQRHPGRALCCVARYHEKYAEKLQQHAQLKTILQAAGYDAEVLPILVGTTRCVYRSTEANLKRLGVSHEEVQRLLKKLAVEAARSAHAIICTRRQLDSQSQVQRRDPP